jgi:hypothetical protein
VTTFVTVAAFTDPSEAHVVRGLFESDGIASILGSEHHVSTFWPLSQALGGVRLQVLAEYRDRAAVVLEAYRSGDYEAALAEQFHLAKPICTNCGSSERRPERSWFSIAFLLPALLAGVGFRPKQIGYRCSKCGVRVADVL